MAAEGEVGLIDIGQGSNTTEYRSRRARDSRDQQSAVTAAAAAAYKQRRTSYRRQPGADAGGRRQYSTAIQVPPLPSSSSDTLTLLCWGLKKLKINSIFFLLLGLATSGLQGRNAKKAKVQQQKQKLTCDISAAMRADGAPSPPRDGDTTGGGGGGCIPMQLHRGTA